MSIFQAPDMLRQHRSLLLALEAIGWLHMAFKARVAFLQKYGRQHNDCAEKNWVKEGPPFFPWDTLLKWVKDDFFLHDKAWPNLLKDFFGKHKKGGTGLLGLLQAGHAMASGIEKNISSTSSEYLCQSTEHMWLSTAFGHPVRNLWAHPPTVLTLGGWDLLRGNMETLLRDLEQLGSPRRPHTVDDVTGWRDWREAAVGREGWLRRVFTSTLAETRLPNNDVTLFDQSYVAAALFKSAAAGALLEGSAFPWDNKKLKQQSRWRLLTIGVGADHYEDRAVKIGDWTGARLMLDEFFAKVCTLVEVDLAVGSLLYRDGATCVFSFPGERVDEDSGDLQIADWQRWLIERMDAYARDAQFETPPYCCISKPSRSLVPMTQEIRKARKALAVPIHRVWHIPDQCAAQGHVCPVCRMRRNDASHDKQQPCQECRDRRTHRLDAWLQGRSSDADTIWISEVADHNDRVALITMGLDMEPWLDGTRLDSLRAQSIAEWVECNKALLLNTEDSIANVNARQSFISFRKIIKEKINGYCKNDAFLCNINEGYRYAESWENFFHVIVEDRANAPEWKKLTEDARAAWLTHQFFRKLASPGRIYRFQRQAEEFFNDLLVVFRQKASACANKFRSSRLLLKTNADTWKDREPYNGFCDGKPLDLLYRKDLKGFLTIFNMARIVAQSKEELCGKSISLKNDDGKAVDTLTVKGVGDAPAPLCSYHPVIPLEISPVRFRALVPLCAASDCVDYATAAWKDQFSQVWDRLPLRVGVVAFPRKTPFQAVLEATRNIENEFAQCKTECWQVVAADAREGVVQLRLDPQRDSAPDVVMTMRRCLPDQGDDVFYPYLAVSDKDPGFLLDFQHPDGQVYRHVTDLKCADQISVQPARIATLFLDGTARRFERIPCLDLLTWPQMRELRDLLERSIPSQTALRGAWAELCERREAWRGPDHNWLEGGKEAWLDLARTIFRTRLRLCGPDLDRLVQAAANDLLPWCLEWHLNILKEDIPLQEKRTPGGEL